MKADPNFFAYFVLILWPIVAIYLYLTRPVGQATIWTILGAYLLLPVGAEIHFEGVPQLDKETIGNLAALVGLLLVGRRVLRFSNGFGLAEILLLIFLLSPFITEELNTDPIVRPNLYLPAGSFYDGLSAVVRQFLLLIPFFIGRQVLRNSSGIEATLRALVIAGLLYSLPILLELRISPQLHAWVYGYYPFAQFLQMMRDGGYRPMVFIGHGLAVSFFIMTTVVAAAALWKTRTRILWLPPGSAVGYLSVVLLLCKSMAPMMYGGLSLVLVRFMSPRTQVRIAAVLVTLTIFYPLLRTYDLVPTGAMLDMAAAVNPDRAASLGERFDQEQQLLERAYDRIYFGWGRFGRNRIYDSTGRDRSISDGNWVITIGMFGLVGFIGQFGLLALPIYRVLSTLKFAESERDGIYLAALALISAIGMFDLLPNDQLTPWTWLLSGALLGRAELLGLVARQGKSLAPIQAAFVEATDPTLNQLQP